MTVSIWVEKYKPRTLSDVIFQDERQRQEFTDYVRKGDIPNLAFFGVQGTGKSSLSSVLVKDLGVDPSDVLKFNASKDKMEKIRTDVEPFILTMPNGPFKVVRMEEFDGMSLDGQKSLRAMVGETAASSVRWIFTANYDNRIIPAIRSRLQATHFKAPDKDQIALRMVDILVKEQIEFEPEDVLTYIDVAYPDIRQIIGLLQKNSTSGKLLPPGSAQAGAADWRFELLNLLGQGDFTKARKVVLDNAAREELEGVYTFLYQNLKHLKVNDPDAAVITIAEYAYRNSTMADQELNLAALFIALKGV